MRRDADARTRALLLVLAVAVGVFLRLRALGDQALFGDEYHTLEACEASVGTILTTFDSYGSHVVLPLLQHAALAIVGDGVWSLRLPAIVPGIALLLLLYPLARRPFGPVPALLATGLVAIHPMLVYYTRFARSYALTLLLGVLLIGLLARLLRPVESEERDAARRARGAAGWFGVGALAFLLPYTHLSSAGFVAAAGLAALALAPRAGVPLSRPVFAFGGAAVACFLAFLPVLGQVRDYFVEAVPEESKQHPTTWFGIPLLLAGGAVAAWVWLVAVPFAVAVLVRRRREAGVLVLAAVVGPLLTLLATRPHGMEFAWARYLLLAVPVVPLALGALLVAACQRVFPGVRGERVALALGVLGLALTWVGGPFARGASLSGTFDNTYLAIRPLPTFDASWPDAPTVYDELAGRPGELRVVELPPILSRAVLLLRNHERHHGHRALVGWPPPAPAGIRGPGGPYASLDALDAEQADVVILHKAIRQEVSAYWRFVHDEVWPRLGGDDADHVDRGFMRRHAESFVRGQASTSPEFVASLDRYLRELLGPPDEEDARVAVWWLSR